jgi:CHAD domain-containing protein
MIAYELKTQRQGRAVLAALRERFRTDRGDSTRDERTCFDTFDWRLWRAGATLAGSREGRRWVLHWCREEGVAGHRERSDAPPAFVWDLPQGRLRSDLEGLVEMRRLLPLAELAQRSEEVRLLDRREKTVARLRLEGWRVHAAESRAAKRLPPRLVAAPVRGYDRDFARLLRFLERQGLERASRSVLERAYEACDLQPGDYQAKLRIPLEPELPAHLAMRRIHRQLLDTIRRNEEGLRQDLDSEFLHDFRVAVRRTRSALSQVKGVLPLDRVSRFRKEFSWLGGQTGALRDLDVYLLKLDDYRASLPVEVAADLGPLEVLLRRKQKSEHRRVARALGTQRYGRLVTEWEGFLADEETPDTPAGGLAPIGQVARDRIVRAHGKVIKKGRAIGPSAPDEKLHRLRIDCKKLRYLLEFFRDLYEPDGIGKVIKALKGLQDNLGDFNDLTVQQGAMEQFAEELTAARAPAAALLALGQLIANLARRHDEERRRFHEQFERFDRRKIRQRLIRLVESAAR